ncbi:MAG TPA: hypothetical protein VMR81_06575 [Patescibacteria group bacterium]|nr:hypothetical protein [Patescibacteria group bacterium]
MEQTIAQSPTESKGTPPVQPPTTHQNKSTVIIIIFISLLVIGGIVFAGYRFYLLPKMQSQSPARTTLQPLQLKSINSEPTNTANPAASNKTHKWIIYQNTNANYQLSYPDDYTLVKANENTIQIVNGLSNIMEIQYDTTMTNIDDKLSNIRSGLEFNYPSWSVQSVKFHDKDANSVLPNSSATLPIALYVVQGNYAVYAIRYSTKPEDKEVVNAILSSLKFLDSTAIAKWNTYQDPTKTFSLQYPSTWSVVPEENQVQFASDDHIHYIIAKSFTVPDGISLGTYVDTNKLGDVVGIGNNPHYYYTLGQTQIPYDQVGEFGAYQILAPPAGLPQTVTAFTRFVRQNNQYVLLSLHPYNPTNLSILYQNQHVVIFNQILLTVNFLR